MSRTDHPSARSAGSVELVPTTVWATGQQMPGVQRRGRYVPDSTAHPAKMLPAVAAHAIAHYTRPGEWVLDPMCGIGTTLVEALHAGRPALGVEYEPHWVDVTRANIDHTHHLLRARAAAESANADSTDAGPSTVLSPVLSSERLSKWTGELLSGVPTGRVWQGDARRLETVLPAALHGQVALMITSPPYGPSIHGRVVAGPGVAVKKYWNQYSRNSLDRANLANVGHRRLLTGFTAVLRSVRPFLRPGGHIAITVRPWRQNSELIDLPSQIITCGVSAGLIPVERCVALLGRLHGDRVIEHGSFFHRNFVRKQRESGLPLHLIVHEDVIILRVPEDGRDQPPQAPALPDKDRALVTALGYRSSNGSSREHFTPPIPEAA